MWALLALRSEPDVARLYRVREICSCEQQVFTSLQQYPDFTHSDDGGPAVLQVADDATDFPLRMFAV
eukprot:5955937-Pleurochrysis_carterae.AAC.1